MGMTLFDRQSGEIVFDTNFWHYRAIVEAVRGLEVLPDDTVERLHYPFEGNGLTADECRRVAAAIRSRLLPTLQAEERLLLDGTRTLEPDDGTLHRLPEEQHRSYSTNREALERFARCCETCGGFDVS